MEKRLQIFISSTFEDMRDERQAAVEAILEMNHIPAGMEWFTGENEEQLKVINKWIDQSDIFLLILGGRYGSIYKPTGKSFVHMEYDHAKSNNIPIAVFVMGDDFVDKKKANAILAKRGILYKQGDYEYDQFRAHIEKSGMVKPCKDIQELTAKIGTTLNAMQSKREHKFVGWVRANEHKSNALIIRKNLEDLSKRVERAQKEIVITGVSLLGSILEITDELRGKLRAGIMVKLVFCNPKGAAMSHIAEFFGRSKETQVNDIRGTIEKFANELEDCFMSENLELFFHDGIATSGYLCLDRGTGDCTLTRQPYMHRRVTGSTVPVTVLHEKDAHYKDVFAAHFTEFESILKHAARVDKTKLGEFLS